MKLSILNYGVGATVEVPAHAKKEDEALIRSASDIARERSFGKGAVLVSEVMHTDLVNLNYRCYKTKGLDEAVASFYTPIFTPFLMHHDSGSSAGGSSAVVAVGTNLEAKLFKRKVELATGTASGYVKVATFVGDKMEIGGVPALEAIRNRQLMGLSIGSRVDDSNYLCSICGKSLYSEECEHHTGQQYDGKLCYAEVYRPFFREYSAVYSPADVNALIRRVDVEDSVNGVMENHLVDQCVGSVSMSIYETAGNIYPSAAAAGVHSASDGQEDDMNMKEFAAIIAEYEQKIATMKLEHDNLVAGLKNDIAVKDKVIAALAQQIRDAEEAPTDAQDEGDHNTPEPQPQEEGDAPAGQVPAAEVPTSENQGTEAPSHSVTDATASNDAVEGEGSQAPDAPVEGTDGTPTDSQEQPTQPSGEEAPASSEAADATAPASGSTDEHQSYRTLLRSRDVQFGILSVSSSGSRGKIPSRFRI